MQYLSNENEACNSGVSWLRSPGWRFLAEESWLRNPSRQEFSTKNLLQTCLGSYARVIPEIWRFGDLEIQKSKVQKIEKITVLKNEIRSAQKVGKVWIGRNKTSRPHFMPVQPKKPMDQTNLKIAQNVSEHELTNSE